MKKFKFKVNKKNLFIILACLLLIIFVVSICFAFSGEKTVEEKVEEYFEKYTSLDRDVVRKIKYSFDDNLTSEQEKEYVSIIKNQYENLDYEITSVSKEAYLTYVDVRINVYDLMSAKDKADSYVNLYKEEFTNKGKFNEKKAVDYKLKALKETKEKISYSIIFTFQEKDGENYMLEVSDSDLRKISGTY